MTLIFFFSNDINANLWQFLKPTWNLNRSPVWRRHYLSRQISEGFLNIFFLIFKQNEGSCRTISFVPSIEVLIFLLCQSSFFQIVDIIFPEKTSIVSRFGRQSVGRLPVHSLPIVDRLKHHRCSPSIVVQRLIDSLPLLLFVFMVLWKHLMLILCSDQIFRPTKWKKKYV